MERLSWKITQIDRDTTLINQLLDNLPEHLRERLRVVRSTDTGNDGQFVLYWMQTAMRLEENPALDVAQHIAVALKLPLLVYQGLSAQHAYASDRQHTFILQGASDLQQAARQRDIAYLCVLERSGDELKGLLQRAALVVVEDMPTDPARFFRRAALRASTCSMWAVDTACIAPMQLVGKAYERAFEFRNATRKLIKQRLSRSWPTDTPKPSPCDPSQLNLRAIDFSRESIPDLIAACPIDHLVPPVIDTPGGTTAGYARWEEFKRSKLPAYAQQRNDALKDASSRMSAYLHYGMVSPMRIAREAAGMPGPGPEKFLDELLVWRELAYVFCHYRPDHDRYAALPDWARRTLEDHLGDRRTQQYTWEELSRGATLDAFWNAAERWLLVHGELHNNVRMTWGKAVLAWCNDPRAALKHLIDLNHRYALDGRDPSSFGGLLWCFGQFDRPFQPAQPIYGTVRTRPTWEHAKRLDVKEYARRASTPRNTTPLRIAVIGAGLSGSLAARTLQDHGEQVEIFEKSERPSGRMSTRRTEHGEFDHGAQYFTARDRTFRRYVESWIESEAVAQWHAPIAVFKDGQLERYSDQQRYVAVPHMNELGKRLTRLMPVQYGLRIATIARCDTGWLLTDTDGRKHGPYDRVLSTLPAPQTAELIEGEPAFVAQLREQRFHPCWAVMASLSQPLPVDFGGAFINSGGISWMARNQTKPGRSATGESIVLHASPEWTLEHWEDEKAQAAETLLQELWPSLGLSKPITPIAIDAHRWMFSRPVSTDPLPYRCLFSDDRTLVACGDWAAGGRVEGAFLSGAAAVGILLSTRRSAGSATWQAV